MAKPDRSHHRGGILSQWGAFRNACSLVSEIIGCHLEVILHTMELRMKRWMMTAVAVSALGMAVSAGLKAENAGRPAWQLPSLTALCVGATAGQEVSMEPFAALWPARSI